MKKQLIDYLKNLDISTSEAELYFTLLDTGPLNARSLAQAVGVKRTTAYNYIDHLIEKGLIMKAVTGTRTFLAANPPEEILPVLVEQKIQEGKGLQEALPSILTTLHDSFSLKTKNKIDAEIRSYKGIANARKIYEEALRSDELHSYIRIDKTKPLFPNNASVFSDAFKKNKKLKIWEIIYDKDFSAPPSQASRSQKGRYFYKYMPKSQKLSSEDILIYDNKIAIVNYLRTGKTSIVLHSSDLYNNFKDIFTFLWDMLPEPNDS